MIKTQLIKRNSNAIFAIVTGILREEGLLINHSEPILQRQPSIKLRYLVFQTVNLRNKCNNMLLDFL